MREFPDVLQRGWREAEQLIGRGGHVLRSHMRVIIFQ
jgi:hypothetical protein